MLSTYDIEPAAAAFVADVQQLAREYAEDAAAHDCALQAVVDECNARIEAAKRANWQAARELNANYSERIRNAERTRAQEAQEHAEDIHEAAAALLSVIGGPLHDTFSFSDDAARDRIEAGAIRREYGSKGLEEGDGLIFL